MTTTTGTTQRQLNRPGRGTGRPVAATGSADAVLTALAGHPGTTAEQLAVATGLGRSTVTKTLACLAAEQRVTRSPGGGEQGRRGADGWSLPPAALAADLPLSAAEEPSAVGPVGDRGIEGRLERGQLRALVAARLAAEATAEFTANRLAGVLGRSAGAVGNALARMVEEGLAVQTGSSPRRYRHAPASDAR